MAYRDPAVRLQRDRERFHRRIAERLAAGLCVKCGKQPPAPDRTVCDPCAKRSYEGSAYFRGMPLYPPSFAVFLRESDECLATFDDEMEVAAFLAFEKLSRDRVEIVADVSPMASWAAWE